VNHDLTARGLDVKHFTVQHHRHSMLSCVFVDTPGFDHIRATDVEILKQIIDWMESSCHKDVQFGGIVYLHDITQSRAQPMAVGTLTPLMLSRPEPARHVLLTTVKWERACQDPNATGRERELKDIKWKKVIEVGAQMCRFTNTKDSAWSIVDALLQREPIKLHTVHQDLDKIYRTFQKVPPKRGRGFFASLFRRVGFKVGSFKLPMESLSHKSPFATAKIAHMRVSHPRSAEDLVTIHQYST